MRLRLLTYITIFLLGVVCTAVFQPFQYLSASAQQSGCQTFPETGKTVCGGFLEYWTTHGGLAQQGYPISSTFAEVSDLDGKQYTVQYFERAVFEYHPELAPPNDILLSQLGTFQFQRKYPSGEPAGAPLPSPAPQSTSIVGQVVDLDKSDYYKMRITVRSVQEVNTLSGKQGQFAADGKYIVLLVTATCTGRYSNVIQTDDLKLVDDKNRRFSLLGYDEHSAASDQFFRDEPFLTFVDPGKSAEEVLVFEAPIDATNYTLVPSQVPSN